MKCTFPSKLTYEYCKNQEKECILPNELTYEDCKI